MTLALGRLLFSVSLTPARTFSLDAPDAQESGLERTYRQERQLAEADSQRARWYMDMPDCFNQ